jgi:ATP-binding cassette, subfamily B, bacterial HlyB/CyaB
MQTGIKALKVIAKLKQQQLDERTLVQQHGLTSEEPTTDQMLRMLKHLGYVAKLKKVTLAKYPANYPLPALLVRQTGTFDVLVKVNVLQKNVTVYDCELNRLETRPMETYQALLRPVAMVLNYRKLPINIPFGFQWFWQELSNHRLIMLEVLLGSFVVQAFGLLTPLCTQLILDKVLVHRSFSTLVVIAAAFLAIMVFEFLLNLARNSVFTHMANQLDAKLGAKLFKHLFGLPYAYFERRQTGTIMTRVKELDTIRDFLTNKCVSVVIDSVFALVFLGVMWLYSVQLTLVVLGFLAVTSIIYAFVTPIFRSRLKHKFEMGAQNNGFLVESITGIQTVKALAVEGRFQRQWEDNLAEYLLASFKLTRLAQVTNATTTLLQKAMTLGILYVGVQQVMANQLTVGQLIAFQMFSNQLASPVLRLVNMWNELQQALLAVNRLEDVLGVPTENDDGRTITLPKLRGHIQLDNVSFRYHPDLPPVMKHVDLTIEAGQCVGLVGRSGSGKSTLTRLIQRLYTPTEGTLLMDDVDIRHLSPAWLRQHIGVVLQDNFLFTGSIRDNIALARQDASIELVIQASVMAGAHEFITRLPEGYDTPVGERGATLSGGQKQRVAIARALLTNPRILILDEATSALDVESEHIITENLARIKQGRTVIIIAHRLSTVRQCDAIHVIDQGQVIESGTYDQLVAQAGLFAGLHHQQMHTQTLQPV